MRIGGGGGEARIMTGSHRYQVASVSQSLVILARLVSRIFLVCLMLALRMARFVP
jgi:hypothetical protein